MRTAAVIAIICTLIILAFSPVWYDSLTGADRNIVDSVESSTAEVENF